ncbi:hypothetical protein EON82_14520, partial [bacterium]
MRTLLLTALLALPVLGQADTLAFWDFNTDDGNVARLPEPEEGLSVPVATFPSSVLKSQNASVSAWPRTGRA